MNAANTNIDALLEQVAEALADGQNELAAHLLPDILQSGDEVQRLMAESYLMQIDALQALEQNDTIPKDNFLEVDEDLPEMNEANDLQSLSTKAKTSYEDTTIRAESLKAKEITPSPVTTTQSESNVLHSEISKSKQGDNSDYISEEFTEFNGDLPVSETISDIIIDSTVEQKSDVLNACNRSEIIDKSSSETDDEEINTALVQAEMLIIDEEYETAKLVLQAVLDSNNEASCNKAKAMILLIADKEALIRNDKIENAAPEDVEDHESVTPTSVIDAIFEEKYEDFSRTNNNIERSETENPPLSDILAIETQITDNGNNNKEATAVIKNVPENSLLSEFSTEQVIENTDKTIATETTEDLIVDDIEDTIVTEVFFDNEEVKNLLSPTLALQGIEENLETMLPNNVGSVDSVQRQGFYIGNLGLMIDFASGSELTEMPHYFSVPNAPKWFIGLTNMHGGVIPIFDLQTYFNITNKHSNTNNKKMLLILKYDKSEKMFGIVVNGLPTRLSWSDTQKVNTNTSPASIRSHINTACLIDGDLWFDLDTETLANTLENAI